MIVRIHWEFTRGRVPWKIILVSHTRPLFRSTKANYLIGQLWQLLTASNVGARTQAWQAKWAVFKIPGFVCKRFLPFFPTPSPLFYLRHFSRGLWLSFLVLCSYTARKRLLRRLCLLVLACLVVSGRFQRKRNHVLSHLELFSGRLPVKFSKH